METMQEQINMNKELYESQKAQMNMKSKLDKIEQTLIEPNGLSYEDMYWATLEIIEGD